MWSISPELLTIRPLNPIDTRPENSYHIIFPSYWMPGTAPENSHLFVSSSKSETECAEKPASRNVNGKNAIDDNNE